MKKQSITSERELNDEDTANLSDGEFKALVIKMLTDLIELGRKMKDTKMKYSKIFREPTVTGRKPDSKQRCGTKGRSKHTTRTE